MEWATLKLDMTKTYNRMEWSFLEKMMVGLGFATEWVDRLVMCVTTVRYTIMVNGQPGGLVVPSRRLRQGDPLSPYLFIICAEGLSLLLQRSQSQGLIHKCRVSRWVLAVTHLFFAGDNLLSLRQMIWKLGRLDVACPPIYKVFSLPFNRNKLLTSEMCHGLKLGNQDVVPKLDMAKAYDQIS